MTFRERLTSNGREYMPAIAYRLMAIALHLQEFLFHASDRLDQFDIRCGDVIIDYGCGPGRYIPKAAELVGDSGAVYAVDIHPSAVRDVEKLARKRGLTNVKPVQAEGYTCPIGDHAADLIYALDMFHMIADPQTFLAELRRLLKIEGALVLDDGHQPRQETLRKLKASGLWTVSEESRDHLKCRPQPL